MTRKMENWGDYITILAKESIFIWNSPSFQEKWRLLRDWIIWKVASCSPRTADSEGTFLQHTICMAAHWCHVTSLWWTECWDITSIYLMRVKSSLTKQHVPVLKALLLAMCSSTPREPSSAAMSVPFQYLLSSNTVSWTLLPCHVYSAHH